MIIMKKALPRRTFLKGVQAALALPLLDAMIPAATALAKTPAKPVRRLGFVFIPMGCDHARWTPAGQDTLGELSPILAPLAPVKDQLTVVTQPQAGKVLPRHARHVERGVPERGLRQTHRELGLLPGHDRRPGRGQADGPGHATAVARAVDGPELARRRVQQRLRLRLSELPLLVVSDDPAALRSASAPRVRAPLRRRRKRRRAARGAAQPRQPARFVQRRHRAPQAQSGDRPTASASITIWTASARSSARFSAPKRERRTIPMPDLDRPVGVPAAFADHAKLMFDLQVLAFQADITRVVTFQLTRELSNRTYPEIGVPDPHHPTSHHGNDPEKIAKIAKINAFHVSLFAQFLEKLKATPDGDGSLLDNTVYLYGSGMGNSSMHDHDNLPILVAGGAACGLKGGRHIRYKDRHAAGESPPHAARPGGRPAGYIRRQQRQDRRPLRAGVPVIDRVSSRLRRKLRETAHDVATNRGTLSPVFGLAGASVAAESPALADAAEQRQRGARPHACSMHARTSTPRRSMG